MKSSYVQLCHFFVYSSEYNLTIWFAHIISLGIVLVVVMISVGFPSWASRRLLSLLRELLQVTGRRTVIVEVTSMSRGRVSDTFSVPCGRVIVASSVAVVPPVPVP